MTSSPPFSAARTAFARYAAAPPVVRASGDGRVFEMPEGAHNIEQREMAEIAPTLPIPGVPTGGVPSLVPLPTGADWKAPRPQVPETAPDPERGLSVLAEIRQRGLRTKGQIQAAFPQLNREQAALLRDQAWPPVPVPVPESVKPVAATRPAAHPSRRGGPR